MTELENHIEDIIENETSLRERARVFIDHNCNQDTVTVRLPRTDYETVEDMRLLKRYLEPREEFDVYLLDKEYPKQTVLRICL